MPDDKKNEALLTEMRDRYRYLTDQWKEPRDERATDLRFIAGNPWEEKERKARADSGRLCINHDELGQYVNAVVNNLRQNRRGIQIEPRGEGASEQTAQLRQDLIRAIEYDSHAQATYLTAFQQAVEGSYGFFRLSREYVSDDSFEQRIRIKNIPNPDSVLYDCDCAEADWSDAKDCFVLNPLMTRDEFEKRWPNAEVTDFTAEHTVATDWLRDDKVLTAEYWRVENKPETLYLLDDGSTTTEKPQDPQRILKARRRDNKTIVQYWTNGVEILERNEEPGTLLPIIPMIGLQRWIDEERVIFSLVRLARDPQMTHAYLCSQEMEEAALTPKAPYVGYTGQFETDSDAWETAMRQPHAYLQADPIVDGATGTTLPLPRREQFTPNFQSYEVAKESTRRAIQAAMGISPLPTSAQRQNEKSGVALERIQSQQEIGSFHFVDAFDRALEYAGRVIESWIPIVYDTERSISLRDANGQQRMVRINSTEPVFNPKTQELEQHQIEDVDHQVTISTAPSSASTREAADQFLETLIGSMGKLPLAPPQQAKLLALAIKMRELGPIGDQMCEIVDPSQGGNQTQAELAQAEQHGAQMQQALQEMQSEVQKLQLEKAGRLIDNQFKMELEKMRNETTLAVAEVSTKAQQMNERMSLVGDLLQKLLDHSHDAGTQAADHQHQQRIAQTQGAIASQQAQQQAQLQAAQQPAAPSPKAA